jgi:glycosyl transferase family 87
VSLERLRTLGGRLAVSGAGDVSIAPPVGLRSRGAQTSWATYQVLTLLLLTLFVVALVALEAAVGVSFGWDFNALYQAGREYLHLQSPYVSGSLAELTSRENFVYPLPIAAIFAPLSLMPYGVAAATFVGIGALCLVLTLRLLGVRDWRCYAAVLVGIPAFEGVGLGTLSPLLALLLALLWRYRDRDPIAIPVVTFLVLAKLFLWPLFLWLLITRRFRAAALSVAACAVSVLVFSLPVGLGALTHYPVLLRSLSSFEAPMSMSLLSLGQGLSGSYAVGIAITAAAGLALVGGMLAAARNRDELRAFALSIVAALALSPIVWNHYLLLLFVPLALTRPRFSVIWLASAWIQGDGTTLGRSGLAILTVAAWLVILAQAGVLSGRSTIGTRRRTQIRVAVSSLGGGVALWIALGWVVLTLAGEVPAFAALTPPPPGTASASGTAALRVLHGKNSICWKILTSGIPQVARAEILQQGAVVVKSPLRAGQSDTCVEYAARHKNLAGPFAAGKVRLTLEIVGPRGADLLRGRLLRNPPTLSPSSGSANAGRP